MDERRYECGNKLLSAASEFWQACWEEGQRGAVQWLTDEDGRLLIFTRSEYKDQLLSNVFTIKELHNLHIFGERLETGNKEDEE